jgi:predicted GNAT family acetyltransferase
MMIQNPIYPKKRDRHPRFAYGDYVRVKSSRSHFHKWTGRVAFSTLREDKTFDYKLFFGDEWPFYMVREGDLEPSTASALGPDVKNKFQIKDWVLKANDRHLPYPGRVTKVSWNGYYFEYDVDFHIPKHHWQTKTGPSITTMNLAEDKLIPVPSTFASNPVFPKSRGPGFHKGDRVLIVGDVKDKGKKGVIREPNPEIGMIPAQGYVTVNLDDGTSGYFSVRSVQKIGFETNGIFPKKRPRAPLLGFNDRITAMVGGPRPATIKGWRWDKKQRWWVYMIQLDDTSGHFIEEPDHIVQGWKEMLEREGKTFFRENPIYPKKRSALGGDVEHVEVGDTVTVHGGHAAGIAGEVVLTNISLMPGYIRIKSFITGSLMDVKLSHVIRTWPRFRQNPIYQKRRPAPKFKVGSWVKIDEDSEVPYDYIGTVENVKHIGTGENEYFVYMVKFIIPKHKWETKTGPQYKVAEHFESSLVQVPDQEYSENPNGHRWGAWPGEDPLVGEVVIDSHPNAATHGRTAVVTDRRSFGYLLKFQDGTEVWRTPLQVRRMPGKLGWRSMVDNPEGMKSCYMDKESRAIADLVDYYGKGMLITRINVPTSSRGKGAGSKLLRQIIADADRTNTVLYLEVVPTGTMNEEQLTKWYESYGFKYWKGFMRRKPSWRSMTENPVYPKKRDSSVAIGRRVRVWDKKYINYNRTGILFKIEGDIGYVKFDADGVMVGVPLPALEAVKFEKNPIYDKKRSRGNNKYSEDDVVEFKLGGGGTTIGLVRSFHAGHDTSFYYSIKTQHGTFLSVDEERIIRKLVL